jgi:hypothetical protein
VELASLPDGQNRPSSGAQRHDGSAAGARLGLRPQSMGQPPAAKGSLHEISATVGRGGIGVEQVHVVA